MCERPYETTYRLLLLLRLLLLVSVVDAGRMLKCWRCTGG